MRGAQGIGIGCMPCALYVELSPLIFGEFRSDVSNGAKSENSAKKPMRGSVGVADTRGRRFGLLVFVETTRSVGDVIWA